MGRAHDEWVEEDTPVLVITFLLRRRADVSAEEFHTYWKDRHGPLVVSLAPTLGIRQYRQLHATDSPAGTAIAAGRGCAPTEWDGVALIWIDSEQALAEAVTTPEGAAAAAALLEDERRFIDLARCEVFLSEDHTLIA